MTTALAYPEREVALCIGVVQRAGAFEEAVRAGLLDEHFTGAAAKAVWTAVRTLRETGKDVRWLVLEEILRHTPHLESARALLRGVKSTPPLTDEEAFDDAAKIVAAARARHAAREISGALEDLTTGTDPQEALRDFEDRAFALAMAAPPEHSETTLSATLSGIFTKIADPVQRHRKITGVPCHIRGLDQKLRGFQAANVTLIGARPGTGKTAFVTTSVARQVELHDPATAPMFPCLFFSLEMKKEALVERVLCEMAKVSYERMLFGDPPSQPELRRLLYAADQIKDAPLEIKDASPQTVEQIAAVIYRWHRRRWPKGPPRGTHASVVIDYLTIIKWSPGIKDEQAHVRHCMAVLNAVAKNSGISIVMLCQMTRAFVNEGRWPEPSDLRGGGEIEEGANAIVLLHPLGRQEDADAGKPWRGLIVGIIAKNRGGEPGPVMLKYEGERFEFREWNKDTDGPIEDVLHGTGRPAQQRGAKPAGKPAAKQPPHAPPPGMPRSGGVPTMMPAHKDLD